MKSPSVVYASVLQSDFHGWFVCITVGLPDAAPESVDGASSAQSDVYTLGLLLFQLLELRDNPFHGWCEGSDGISKQPSMSTKISQHSKPNLQPLQRRMPAMKDLIEKCLRVGLSQLQPAEPERPVFKDVVMKLLDTKEELAARTDIFMRKHFHMPRDMDESLMSSSGTQMIAWSQQG